MKLLYKAKNLISTSHRKEADSTEENDSPLFSLNSIETNNQRGSLYVLWMNF